MGYTGGDEHYCPSCGEALEPSDHFCPQCGRENEHAGDPPPEAERRSRNDPPANGGWETGEQGRGAGRDPRNQGPQPPRQGRGGDGDGYRRGRGARRPSRQREGPRRPPEKQGRAPPGFPGLRENSEAAWKPVLIGVGLAGLSILLLLVFTVLSFPLVGALGLSTGAALIIGAAAGQYFGFFGLALAYLRYTRDFEWPDVREYLGVRVPSLKELGIVVGGWFSILVLSIIISILISLLEVQSADNESADQLAESAGTDPLLIAGVFALMFLVVGPCEEILYRGVIQNRLRERFSKVPGIVAASIIFASVHVIALGTTDPIAVLTTISVLAVTALVLGGVYEYTGNLVVPWLVHSIHNSIIFTVVFFGPSAAESSLLVPVLAVLPI